MCGIAGYLNKIKNFDESQNISLLQKFCSLLRHRGPDSKGIWYDINDKIFLSHTRLSINDLTQNGSQPMVNDLKNHIVIFNGEIYNHLYIREKYLKNYKIDWKSNSDTETLLKTIEFYGVKKSLEMFEGMFSFCLFNKSSKKIYLARDKFGEKPMFYGVINDNFVFGSELKIFNSFPNFKKKISKTALSLFLKYSYIPEPLSIYDKIFKLNAGEFIELDLKKIDFENPNYLENLKKIKWYNENFTKNFIENKDDSLKRLDKILNESVEESLLSDVEVGTFLSGGLDSSMISSIAQKQSKRKIKTFSICFDDSDYNEQKYSRLVAEHISSDHKDYFVNSQDMFEYYEKICEIYDEPFADSSQIPTTILSKFASESVKVCLTGDGADELFGGYNRYLFINKIKSKTKLLPQFIKDNLSNFISNLDYSKLSVFSDILNKFVFSKKYPQFDDKLQKLGVILKDSSDEIKMYLNLIEVISDNKNPVFQNHNENNNFFESKSREYFTNKKQNIIEVLMAMDKNIYLTGDILHKVDRAAMFYGLETRVPFLNSKVVNYASSIPFDFKIKNQKGKYMIRELAKKYLPSEIINRKKMGFSIPLDNWITKNSNDFIENFIKKKELLLELGFNYESIINHFNQHKNKKKNWSHLLWNLIIFERWLKKYIT